MKSWIILGVRAVASWIEGLADGTHLTTDPACVQHHAPRPGSRLDRASRGEACVPCMVQLVSDEMACFHLSLGRGRPGFDAEALDYSETIESGCLCFSLLEVGGQVRPCPIHGNARL